MLGGARVRPVFGQVETLVDSGTLTIGGSASITASGAARLGLATALASVVGDDDLGRYILDAVRARDVDVSQVVIAPGRSTGVTVVLSEPDDRAILTSLGTIEMMSADLVPADLLERAGHVHVASFYLQPLLMPGVRALFEAAHAHGATTSLDTNYDPSERWASVGDLLEVTDVFFPNTAEAQRISGCDDVVDAARALAVGGIVAVKQGPDLAIAASGEQIVAVAPPTTQPVDTTGAGDSFTGGFLRAHLMGEDLGAALRLGVACGTLSTRRAGGTQGQATYDEARALAATLTVRRLDG